MSLGVGKKQQASGRKMGQGFPLAVSMPVPSLYAEIDDDNVWLVLKHQRQCPLAGRFSDDAEVGDRVQ